MISVPIVLLCALAWAPLRNPMSRLTQVVHFQQLDVRFDDIQIPNSGWGVMQISAPSQSQDLFCNLNVLGQWQIRNILIHPEQNVGLLQPLTSITFPLGTPDGMQVTGIAFGLTFTSQPLQQAPPIDDSAPVTAASYELHHDFWDTPLVYYPGSYIGLTFTRGGVAHGHSEMKTRPCGENQCVGNAVRINMEWLYKHFHLDERGIRPDFYSLEHWLAWLDYRPGQGCPNGCGATRHWDVLKNGCLNEMFRSTGVRITTKKAPGKDGIKKAYEALADENCVVEMSVSTTTCATHCVPIRWIEPQLNERGEVVSYEVEAMECAPQDNKESSCKDEHLTVNLDGTVTDGKGAPWYGGAVLDFVIQCYKP